MPIATTDLGWYYSVATATAGDTTVGTAAGSLGGFLSTTPFVDATLDNLFPDQTGDENANLVVDYKCLFFVNNHPTLTLQNAVVWIYSQVAGGANNAFATDQKGWTAKGSTVAQAASIASKDTAPVGVTAFSLATTKASGLPIGNIPPLSCAAVWIQRTGTNAPAQVNDGVSLRCEGDTSQ